MNLRISWKFQRRRMFLSGDIEFSSELDFYNLSVATISFSKFNISRQKHSFSLKLFGYSKIHLAYTWTKFQDKTPVFGFWGRCLGIGRNFSKTLITVGGKTFNSNPFEVCMRILYRIFRQNSIELWRGHRKRFPR